MGPQAVVAGGDAYYGTLISTQDTRMMVWEKGEI
jgi:hypothetical protein